MIKIISKNEYILLNQFIAALRTQSILNYALLFFIGLLTYVLFLGGHPLLNPDEARYTEITREMLAYHQYITPKLNGVVFFDKPILFYWLQAFALWVFGVNEFAARFFPMLFSLFGALCIYNLCFYLFNWRAAWIAALILLASPLYYFTGHYANLDLEVAVWISLSLSFYLRAYDPVTSQLARGWLYAAYAAAGLAVLTKGLIGLAFPVMIIGLWVMLTNQWFLLKQMRIFTGFLIILAICLPWFIFVQKTNPGFSYYYFYIQQVLRFLTPNFNNHQSIWFYLPVIVIGMFPWILLIYPAIKSAYQEKNKISLFLLLWASIIFIFFSIPQSKLIGYMVPIVFPLAILIASTEACLKLSYQKASLLLAIFVFSLGIVTLIIGSRYFSGLYGISLNIQMAIGVNLLLLNLILIAAYKKFPKQAIFFLCFGYLCFYNLMLFALNNINPQVLRTYFPIKTLAHEVKPFIKPNTQIIVYDNYFQDLPFYTQKQILIARNWDTPNLASKDNWQGESAYAMKYLQPNANKILISFPTLVQYWQSKPVLIFVLKKQIPALQSQLSTSELHIVAQAGKIVVVSN